MPDVIVDADPAFLALLSGLVLPLIVATVTKRVTKSNVQATLLLVLSLVAGALTSIAESGGRFNLKEILVNIAVCFGTGQTSYTRLYKPTGLSDKLQGKGGIITAADPEKVKALEGKPADADAAGEVLGDTQEVVPAQGVDGHVEDPLPYDEGHDPDVAVIDPDDLPQPVKVVESKRTKRKAVSRRAAKRRAG
jgi:hypothetical protein